MSERKMVQIGEYGRCVGESHGRAKLSDHEIDLVRQLREEGMPAAEIAEKFEVSKRYVYKLANYERRACVISEWKRARGRGGA
jgi:DNA invertase Pin-like site-specific DNA recombinase